MAVTESLYMHLESCSLDAFACLLLILYVLCLFALISGISGHFGTFRGISALPSASSWLRLLVACHNSEHLPCFSCPNCQSCQLVYCISVCHISQSDVGARRGLSFSYSFSFSFQNLGQNTRLARRRRCLAYGSPNARKLFIDVDEVVAAAAAGAFCGFCIL